MATRFAFCPATSSECTTHRMNNEGVKDFFPEEQRAAPIISAVKAVSEQTGRGMAQVALAWLRHRTVPVIPIIGARKVSQLQDNLGSLDLELSAEQLKSLDEESETSARPCLPK